MPEAEIPNKTKELPHRTVLFLIFQDRLANIKGTLWIPEIPLYSKGRYSHDMTLSLFIPVSVPDPRKQHYAPQPREADYSIDDS